MIKEFIVYDNDGNILRQGHCPESMMDIQAEYGEYVTKGRVDDEELYQVNATTKRPVKKSVTKINTIKKARDDRKVEGKRNALIRDRAMSIMRAQAIQELEGEGLI